MSRKVITDLVLPIILRELRQNGVDIPSYAEIRDERLYEFLEEQLKIHFSICGKSGSCSNLQKAIEEAKKLNEYEYERFIVRLFKKYIKLRKALTQIDPIPTLLQVDADGYTESSPPDRFTNFRKKNPYSVSRYIRSDDNDT